jgi:hypothetical protein
MDHANGDWCLYGNERHDTTHFSGSDFIQFNADGTLSIHDSVNEGSDMLTGKWTIENNKLLILESNYMDYPGGFDITTLTSSTLQLYYKQGNATTGLEQKLNLAR